MRKVPRPEIAALARHKETVCVWGQPRGELTASVEPGLVLVVRSGLHVRLWLNLTHLLVHARLHMQRVLDVRSGRLLDLLLLLLLLLLLELLLGAVVVRWWRHRGRVGHGISGVRVHRSSEIWVGKCFGGGDAFRGVKLQQAFQQVNCCGLISVWRSRNTRRTNLALEPWGVLVGMVSSGTLGIA